MILGMEIVLLVMGLSALLTGKMRLGKNRVVYGAAARMLGIVAMLPLPLALCAGFVVGVVMGPGAPSPLNQSNRWLFIAVECGAIAVALVIIYGVGALAAGQANARAQSQENEQDAFPRIYPERFCGAPITDGALQGTTQLQTMSLLNNPTPRSAEETPRSAEEAARPAEEAARQPQADRSAFRGGQLLLMSVIIGVVVFNATNRQFARIDPAVEQSPRGGGVCHLHFTVPKDAEVFINGARTSAKGANREFVSPPLQPGAKSTYKISVRYTDEQGRRADATRDVPVAANTVVRLDFTPAARPK